MRWAKILSWHGVREDGKTLCGRSLNRTQIGNTRDALPSERSCETCLRLYARVVDAGRTEDV